MTSLTTEHLGVPSSARGTRKFDSDWDRALDALAGRMVWCVTAFSKGRASADELRSCLDRAGVDAGRLQLDPDDPLRRLAEQLDAMLRGSTEAGRGLGLGPGDDEVFRAGIQEGQALVEQRVGPDDVVVLDDPLAAGLAHTVRELGAHVIWRVEIAGVPDDAPAGEARTFLGPYTTPVDAYVMTWHPWPVRGILAEEIVALMPSPDAVTAKEIEIESRPVLHDAGWSSLLADVINGDRGESVGGTRQPRPSVAVR
jgi:trehalose synthase-like protein